MVDWLQNHWVAIALFFVLVWLCVRLQSVSSDVSELRQAVQKLTGAASDIDKLVADSERIRNDVKSSADELNRLVGRAELQDLTQGHMSGIYAMAALILGLLFGLSSSWVIDGGPFLPSGDVLLSRVWRGTGIVGLAILLSVLVGFWAGPRLERRIGVAAKTKRGTFYWLVYCPLRWASGDE